MVFFNRLHHVLIVINGFTNRGINQFLFQLGMYFRPDQPNPFPPKPAAGSDPA